MVLVDNQRTRQAGFQCFTISTNQLMGVFGFEGDLGSAGFIVAIVGNTVGINALGIGQGIAISMTSLGGEFASRHLQVFADNGVLVEMIFVRNGTCELPSNVLGSQGVKFLKTEVRSNPSARASASFRVSYGLR